MNRPTEAQINDARDTIAILEALVETVDRVMSRARDAWSALELVRLVDSPMDDDDVEAFNELTGQYRIWRLVQSIHDATAEPELSTAACRAADEAAAERWKEAQPAN